MYRGKDNFQENRMHSEGRKVENICTLGSRRGMNRKVGGNLRELSAGRVSGHFLGLSELRQIGLLRLPFHVLGSKATARHT